jgi:hypothetical protein
MITVAQAAKMLDSYPKHIRRLIDRGELPGAAKTADLPTAPYLIPLKSVKDYKAKLDKERAAKPGGSTAR